MALNSDQSDRLLLLVRGVENLMAETNQDGAEEILDEMYMLITKILERFPELDAEE